jgi:hypothetical protein
MEEYSRPLDVPQEGIAQTLAFARSLNQARNVGN